MAALFPNALDSFPEPAPNSKLNSPSHSGLHNDVSSAVEALEEKVGVNNSADTDSLDYRVTALENDVQTFDPAPARKVSSTAFESFPRMFVTNSATTVTAGHTYFTFFTCPMDITAANVRVYVNTAGSSSPTTSEIGLYSVDGSGDGTRVAVTSSTVNWASTGMKSYAFTGSAALTAGQRYAISVWQSNGTGPELAQIANGADGAALAIELPKTSGYYASNRAGASFTNANVTNPGSGQYFWFEITT